MAYTFEEIRVNIIVIVITNNNIFLFFIKTSPFTLSSDFVTSCPLFVITKISCFLFFVDFLHQLTYYFFYNFTYIILFIPFQYKSIKKNQPFIVDSLLLVIKLEQVVGIEPTSSAWKAEVLPLNYTCMTLDIYKL